MKQAEKALILKKSRKLSKKKFLMIKLVKTLESKMLGSFVHITQTIKTDILELLNFTSIMEIDF
jgi:hypothetical protein